jgi:hypothetical protein
MAFDQHGQPSPSQRGYDRAHLKEREHWAKTVNAGLANCTRCGLPIAPSAPWHLDHSDVDRSRYIGVAHATCNLKAAAQKARALQTGVTFDGRVAVSRDW